MNAAGGDPRSLKRLSVQFRGMGFPEQEIAVTGSVKEEGDGRVRDRRRGRAGRQQDHQERRGRAVATIGVWHSRPARHSCSASWSRPTASSTSRSAPNGSPSRTTCRGARPRSAPSWPSLEEVGLLEHPHTSAGRVPTDRGYRVYVDELMTAGALPVPRKPLELTDHAARGGRGDARHQRAALAGDEPAGARHRAADRDGDDPASGGAAAPAPGGDGRDHHLDRRRDEAGDLVRDAGRSRAGRLGEQLPERGARRARRGLARCCSPG